MSYLEWYGFRHDLILYQIRQPGDEAHGHGKRHVGDLDLHLVLEQAHYGLLVVEVNASKSRVRLVQSRAVLRGSAAAVARAGDLAGFREPPAVVLVLQAVVQSQLHAGPAVRLRRQLHPASRTRAKFCLKREKRFSDFVVMWDFGFVWQESTLSVRASPFEICGHESL